MPKVRILTIAEIEVDSGPAPVGAALEILDCFRESTLPAASWGLSLSQATEEDLEEFSKQQALLPTPKPIVR